MATYTKSAGGQGAWLDKKLLSNGQQAKLVTECEPVERDYEGKPQTQHIAKIKVKDVTDSPVNVALNATTRNGLIDAFGEDSKSWIGQLLTVEVEKSTNGGKRTITLYLIPEGFELGEDESGYVVIRKIGSAKVSIDAASLINEPVDELDPESIPF